MQTLVIGDIHGCNFELQNLLDKAGLGNGDRIISIGDCVDRGPETPAVLDFFRETSNAQLLMGNHERKHVRASRGEVALARSQQISRIQFGDAYSTAVDFMSRLPMYLDLSEALLVHGCFEPGLPLEKQRPEVLCGNHSGEIYMQARYDQPWHEMYDGEKPILVGHRNYTGTDQPFVYRERVFGLDTDCVTGRALTGILLPSFKFVRVPSRGNLWGQVATQYPRLVRLEPVVWKEQHEPDLLKLLSHVTRLCDSILSEIHAGTYDIETATEDQQKRFAERAGTGKLSNLLHLARMGKLDLDLAKKVLRTPAVLQNMLDNLELDGDSFENGYFGMQTPDNVQT
ncbi:MAG: metallophosphoesterase [Chloroflexota bacterium]